MNEVGAIPSIERVDALIRETAASEIMPLFRALEDHQINEKESGDLVTAADVNAEKRLGRALAALVSGSVVVGEEGADERPATLKALGGDAPVWLIDPVDGTQNFADGKACFAVIVAYCVAGETVAGWIHDPVHDITIWAAAGEGAWTNGTRLTVAPSSPIGAMRGSLGTKFRGRFTGRDGDAPAKMSRLGCVGREYMDLATGDLHFAQYAKRLKPWDHAAGVLMHHEAGGYNALIEGKRRYRPGPGVQYATLLLAPDEGGWDALHAAIHGG